MIERKGNVQEKIYKKSQKLKNPLKKKDKNRFLKNQGQILFKDEIEFD